MRTLLLVILSLTSLNAFGLRHVADVVVNKADMIEMDPFGDQYGIRSLTLKRHFDSSVPTSMTLAGVDFSIVDYNRDSCGSVSYTGLEVGTRFRPGTNQTLTLTDHTERYCDDYKPYRWEAELGEGRRMPRQFFGNP